MEVVVSTPHGHAEIDIVSAPPDTTLADLLMTVTGQAVPVTARVDGRVTATSERIDDLDLCIGATIDTHPEDGYDSDAHRNEVVRLIQLTGRGAGAIVPLTPGRHRIGSARRLHAGELERASVETVAFELEVEADGATTVFPAAVPSTETISASPAYAPTLGAHVVDREMRWTDGRLSIGGRVFELDVPRPADPPARRTKPAADGTIPFQRRTDGVPPGRRPVVDAARDASRRSSLLWRRRRSDPDAFRIGFGIRPDGGDAVADLSRHRTVALIGSDRFGLALARSLLLEAATLHGPADLSIVAATTPGRITFWNWLKWLPHVRRGDPTSPPDLLVDRDEMTRWANRATTTSAATVVAARPLAAAEAGWAPPTAPPATPAEHGPITILVLDDMTLWSRRESPLQALLAAAPPDLRVLALCGDPDDAPERSTLLIEESPPDESPIAASARSGPLRPALFGSLARQHSRVPGEPSIIPDIRPALTEAGLATNAARRLAPLDDLDAVRRAPSPVRPAAPALAELVDDAIGPGLHVAVGARVPDPTAPPARYEPAMLDIAAARTVAVVCDDPGHCVDTITAMVLGAASRHAPDRLAILSIASESPPWRADLPHLSGATDLEHDPSRLVHRVAHVATERPQLQVLVVIDGAFDSAPAIRSGLVDAFLSLSESADNVHVLVSASHSDSIGGPVRDRLGAVASIDAQGRGTLVDGHVSTDFIAIGRADDAERRSDHAAPLVVRSTTHERAMTPLERRLTRLESQQSVLGPDEAAVAAIAQRIASRFVVNDSTAGTMDPPRAISLLPPPLPNDIDVGVLLERFPGDGIPLGLVDRPERAENEAYWWQPGSSGSILAAGSPRSGLTALLDLILVGIAGRVSADDLHVYAIEGLPQRRRALESLPHVGEVVAPDDSMSVERLVDALHSTLMRRTADRHATDRPDIVLLAGDVGRIRRSLPPESVDVVFDRLAQIASTGSSVGINVVAIGGRAEDVGALTRLSGDRLVGDMTDASDRSRFGVPAGSTGAHRVRRCWSTTSERLVQLAAPPESIEDAIAAIAPEAPVRQAPPRLLSEESA